MDAFYQIEKISLLQISTSNDFKLYTGVNILFHFELFIKQAY